jgi:two-component system cell cycle sensor histidine kinase/response regulator CckA
VKILLVDDEPTMLKVMKRVLERRGFQVLQASSGAEALALMDGHSIDVLVTDVVMNDMDGMALARSLVEQRNPSLPVLFISGHPLDLESQRRHFSRCAFLPKPFAAADLVRAISDVTRAIG